MNTNGWIYMKSIPLEGVHEMSIKVVKKNGEIFMGISAHPFKTLKSIGDHFLGSDKYP